MKKTIIIMLAGIMLLAACRKEDEELLNPNVRYNVSTYEQQFDVIWHGIDNSYVFWERDTIDWDAKYKEYKPQFAALDKMKEVPDSIFTDLWLGVVGHLLDHHFYIRVLNFRTGEMINIGGGSKRDILKRPDYQETKTDEQVAILKIHPKLVEDSYKESTNGLTIRSCQFKKDNGNKIAYIRISGFNIFSDNYMYEEPSEAKFYANTSKTWIALMQFYGSGWMNEVYGRYGYLNVKGYNGWINDDDVEGIIFDVRGNGGGDASTLNPLVGGLLTQTTQYGYSRYKEGLGRLDYSPWSRFDIITPSHHINTVKPIIVLADVNSASCSELTTQTIHSLPNGRHVGTRTNGATCPLLPNYFNLLLSGCFGKKDCNNKSDINYYCYTSNFDIVLPDYTSLEGKGITPDVYCQYIIGTDVDEQLDKAIELLNE